MPSRDVIALGPEDWSIDAYLNLLHSGNQIRLSEEAISKIDHCRDYLEQKLQGSTSLFYGINTGFGSLCNHQVDDADMAEHQARLIRSHSAGRGKKLDDKLVKAILLLKIKSFCLGYSGVRRVLVERLIDLYNSDCFPVIYEYGSLGASGDLAPLAHIGLVLIGEGELIRAGKLISAESYYDQAGVSPLRLASKEGLALINGTQFSTALAIDSLGRAESLVQAAIDIASLSMQAFCCDRSPYHAAVHRVRRQEGQMSVADQIRQSLAVDPLSGSYSVQDPYSFRCTPQVLGASRDSLAFAKMILTREINAVTDNPLIIPEEDQIISGGNFHAEPVAQACEMIAIASTEIMNISERRSFLLLCGFRDLPAYLSPRPGTNSGYMIAQYTAASILARSKMLCHPVTVDSIPSSKGQEDHVSLAATAAVRNLEIADNLHEILAIELLLACQALDFRPNIELTGGLMRLKSELRKIVPSLEDDRPIYQDIDGAAVTLQSLYLSRMV